MRSRVETLELVARLFLAVLVAATCASALVYLFAFSSMTGATPSGSARWWGAALDKLFLSSDPGIASWPLSVALLASGYLCARDLVVLLYRIARALVSGEAPAPPAEGARPT